MPSDLQVRIAALTDSVAARPDAIAERVALVRCLLQADRADAACGIARHESLIDATSALAEVLRQVSGGTRITITVWPFVIAILCLAIIMILLIAAQTIKAALANPVKSLKVE